MGILPNVISVKRNRDEKQGISVCSRIIRLTNIQTKSRKKSYIPKRRESDDKNAVAIVKSASQLVCVSQDSDGLVSQGRKSRGNPDTCTKLLCDQWHLPKCQFDKSETGCKLGAVLVSALEG